MLLALLTLGTTMGGCWATLHGVGIHVSELVQLWAALNQLQIV
jgi:hypothetical protein